MAASEVDGEATGINLLSMGLEELQIKQKQSKKKGEKKFDFLKSLDPGRRKLSSVESQRILSSVDDCIRKVEIVTLLPFIIENIERFSILLGSGLVSLIEEYDAIEKNYTIAVKNYRKALRGNEIESRSSESELSKTDSRLSDASDWLARAELEGLSQTVDSIRDSMKSTVKSIVRIFGKNPSALRAINMEKKERAFEANNLVDRLYSLRELIFLRLATSPGEELERVKQFVDLTTKERKAQTTIEKLTGNLNDAIKDKDDEVLWLIFSIWLHTAYCTR